MYLGVSTPINEMYLGVSTPINERYLGVSTPINERYLGVSTPINEGYLGVSTPHKRGVPGSFYSHTCSLRGYSGSILLLIKIVQIELYRTSLYPIEVISYDFEANPPSGL